MSRTLHKGTSVLVCKIYTFSFLDCNLATKIMASEDVEIILCSSQDELADEDPTSIAGSGVHDIPSGKNNPTSTIVQVQKQQSNTTKRPYRKYSTAERDLFFKILTSSMCTIKKAAEELETKYRTALCWVKKYEKDNMKLPEIGRQKKISKPEINEEIKVTIREAIERRPHSTTADIIKEITNDVSRLSLIKGANDLVLTEYSFGSYFIEKSSCEAYLPL